MLHIPIRRAGALLLVALIMLVALPGVAAAHAELKTADPAAKSTVPAPVSEVSGIYTEAMKPAGSSLIVRDITGSKVAEGTVDPTNDTRMVATPATPLEPGAYLVEWTSVALDGHVERGTWTFDVAAALTPSVSPSPTPASTAAPSTAPSATPTAVPSVAPSAPPTAAPTPVPSLPPSAAATPSPSADGSSSGGAGDVVLPIVIALIVLGGGAAYLLSRRGQRPTDPT